MDRATRTTLAALALPAVMVGTDFTGAMALVVLIEQEYSVDITTTQWVLNAYAVTFAMGMVAGGRLGDIFGRRRLLLIGLGVFIAASLACALAPNVTVLIVARAVQGIGSAMVWPSVLAMAATAGSDDERGMSVGLILAAVTSGNVLGPIIAGTIAGLGTWRPFFLVNVVLAGLSVLVALWRLPRQPRNVEERVDYVGMAVLSLAIFGLMFGLDVGADRGWTSPAVIGLLAVCVVLFVAFPLIENRVGAPMVPPPMMRNRQFVLALAANGFAIPMVFLMFLYVPQYLNKGLGWSVSASSFGTFPMYVMSALSALIAGRLYNAIGPRTIIIVGHVLAIAGGLWMIFGLAPALGYPAIVAPMIVISFGVGIVIPAAGTVVVGAVRPERAGLAGGLSFMVHLSIGAIGVAGATALMSAAGAGGDTVTATVFTGGLHRAFVLALILALAGLVVSLLIDDTHQVHADG